ncbi:hypothetical protein EJB05_24952, partial [Eragrostis curvula]
MENYTRHMGALVLLSMVLLGSLVNHGLCRSMDELGDEKLKLPEKVCFNDRPCLNHRCSCCLRAGLDPVCGLTQDDCKKICGIND